VELHTELSIPRASRHVDTVFELEQAKDAWGPIRADVARRAVVLEHFSTPPGADELATSFLKGIWALEQWYRGRWRSRERRPLLLVLSVGRPRTALGRWPCLRSTDVTGILRTTDWDLDVVLVDVKGLPKQAGTAYLRHFDHRKEVRRENVDRLQNDPAIETLERQRIVEEIMKNTQAFDAEERQLTYEAVLKEGREEGREEGRKAALLDVARARLAPEVVEELEAMQDLDALQARLLELLAR
jgi:hypothetical protein